MAQKPDFWLTGLVPAVFTPFDKDGEIDYCKIDGYCDYLVQNGIRGIYVNGTTGEGKSLTKVERQKIVEKWISVSKGRLKVVVHVGSLNVREGKELAKHASEVGADAIATLPSLFFKPQNIGALVDHCSAIASVAPHLPFYYYHLPIMTGVELNMEDFLTEAKERIPNLVGVKFSSQDLVDMLGCVFAGEGRFNLLYGCDEQLLAGFVTGAHGAVGSLHNFMPNVYHRMIKLMDAGDMAGARKEQIRGQQLCRVMYKYGALLGGNVAALKAIMELVGLDLGPPREPMRKLTEEENKQFRSDIEALGFHDWKPAEYK